MSVVATRSKWGSTLRNHSSHAAQRTISLGGAIPLLLTLLGVGKAQRPAASALAKLAHQNKDIQMEIERAGGIAALLPLDTLEQGSEVACTKAIVTLPLDDLEEEWTRFTIVMLGRRLLQEDLEEIRPVGLAIDQDLKLTQQLDVFVDRIDTKLLNPLGQHVVVRARCWHERDIAGSQPTHARDDVWRRKRGMLHAISAMVLFTGRGSSSMKPQVVHSACKSEHFCMTKYTELSTVSSLQTESVWDGSSRHQNPH